MADIAHRMCLLMFKVISNFITHVLFADLHKLGGLLHNNKTIQNNAQH